MNMHATDSYGQDSGEQAFEELRGEVSLLRRAVEGLTAERQNIPDYTPTLTELSQRLESVEELLGKVAQSPSMRLTPENLAVSIARASDTARAGDRELLEKAGGTLQASIASIDEVVEMAWTADRQLRLLCWVSGGSFLLGAVGALSLWHLIG